MKVDYILTSFPFHLGPDGRDAAEPEFNQVFSHGSKDKSHFGL